MEINIENAHKEIERQAQSALDRFVSYQKTNSRQDLTQALFAIGKLAGKIEFLQDNGNNYGANGIHYATNYNAVLSVLREKIETIIKDEVKFNEMKEELAL